VRWERRHHAPVAAPAFAATAPAIRTEHARPASVATVPGPLPGRPPRSASRHRSPGRRSSRRPRLAAAAATGPRQPGRLSRGACHGDSRL